MDKKLQDLIKWLESDLNHFAALVEEGSVATNDPKQDGYSDHDLNIVVYKDVKNEMYAVSNWLEQHPLGNKYLLGPRLFEDYLVGDTLNDLSLKFRSRTIAGRDVLAEKKPPNRDKAKEIGLDGLKSLIPRLERRWLNLAHWTDDYSRHKNYEIYKNFFVFYAALHYGRTGKYPVSRADVAMVIENQQWANDVLKVTNNIAHATKEQQKLAIESATKIINNTTSK